MLPKKLTNTLDRELVQLWSTWSGLGLYSEVKPTYASPETCLIGLSCIGHYDQRLFDEALALINAHPNIIRTPFVNYWIKLMDSASQNRLSLILNFCQISKKENQAPPNTTETFFKNTQQTPYFNGRFVDPYFKEHGFIRNPYIISNNIPDARSISKINPFVKMRLTSGFQAQSDAWVYLLHYRQLTIPKLQSLLGVTTKSTWNIFQNMFQAGWVTKKTMGKIDLYKITPDAVRAFSFIKTPKLQNSPVDWIRLGYRLSVINEKKITDSYYDFLDNKLSKELLYLEILAEKLH